MIQGYGPVTQALLGTLLTWGLTALGSAMVIFLRGNQVNLMAHAVNDYIARVQTLLKFKCQDDFTHFIVCVFVFVCFSPARKFKCVAEVIGHCTWFCGWRYDCCIVLVIVSSSHRISGWIGHVRKEGRICIYTGSGRFSTRFHICFCHR